MTSPFNLGNSRQCEKLSSHASIFGRSLSEFCNTAQSNGQHLVKEDLKSPEFEDKVKLGEDDRDRGAYLKANRYKLEEENAENSVFRFPGK